MPSITSRQVNLHAGTLNLNSFSLSAGRRKNDKESPRPDNSANALGHILDEDQDPEEMGEQKEYEEAKKYKYYF